MQQEPDRALKNPSHSPPGGRYFRVALGNTSRRYGPQLGWQGTLQAALSASHADALASSLAIFVSFHTLVRHQKPHLWCGLIPRPRLHGDAQRTNGGNRIAVSESLARGRNNNFYGSLAMVDQGVKALLDQPVKADLMRHERLKVNPSRTQQFDDGGVGIDIREGTT